MLKRSILAVVLFLGCGLAYAGEALLSWTPPTSYEDGSPLSIAGYNFYAGCVQSGQYSLVETVQNPGITSHQLVGLPDSTVCFFVVTVFDAAGIESVFSNEASKLMPDPVPPPPPPPPVPNPPTNLTVQ